MNVFTIKSHAKINLALNITGKVSKLHKVESIVSFISLHDKIYLKKIKNKDHKVLFEGTFSKNIKKKKYCYNHAEITRSKKFVR